MVGCKNLAHWLIWSGRNFELDSLRDLKGKQIYFVSRPIQKICTEWDFSKINKFTFKTTL